MSIVTKVDAELVPEGNDFGFWVQQQRTKKGWSQLELAEKSGVSQPQISNLEAGRSNNPRQETKKKLFKALGTTLPKRVSDEIETESKIVGVGELIDFDPYDLTDVPSLAGVYVFYDLTNRPVYVGESLDIQKRVSGHEEKFWFKRPLVQSASYVQIDDKSLREKVEKVLIKFLKSNALLNKQHVDRT